MLSHRYLISVSEQFSASTFNEVNRFFSNSGKYVPYKQHYIPEGNNLQLTYGPNFLKASILPLFFYVCKIFKLVHKFSTLFLNGNYLMLKLVVDIDIEKYET
jgi:hypothetical protein